MSNRSSALRSALLLLLLSTLPLAASTVEPLTLADLTERAEVIFLGRCSQAESVGQSGDDVFTRLTFAVDEPLKGVGDTRTLRVRLPGGEIDGVRYSIAGMPTFAPGAEVILFLTGDDGRGRVWPVGLAQGGFRVSRRPGEPARVRRDLTDLQFLPVNAAARSVPVDDGMELNDLLRQIRNLANPGTGAPR